MPFNRFKYSFFHCRHVNVYSLLADFHLQFVKSRLFKIVAFSWASTLLPRERGRCSPIVRSSSTLPGCPRRTDRKSTRLNSSHMAISYAVFCMNKKTREDEQDRYR